jgi:hypothetical protein
MAEDTPEMKEAKEWARKEKRNAKDRERREKKRRVNLKEAVKDGKKDFLADLLKPRD